MLGVKLRHSARALILTDNDRILLCRHVDPDPGRPAVWAPPGGGLEPGETLLAALHRELREEVGLVLDRDPPHVWHREVVRAGHLPGYDGVVQDYFLVRSPTFAPRGTMSDDQLAAENIGELRWWSIPDIAGYRGTDLFGPRGLAGLLTALLNDGVPAAPRTIDV